MTTQGFTPWAPDSKSFAYVSADAAFVQEVRFFVYKDTVCVSLWVLSPRQGREGKRAVAISLSSKLRHQVARIHLQFSFAAAVPLFRLTLYLRLGLLTCQLGLE